MIHATTNLNKIAALKSKIKGIQGGQGAAKTFSILILIINHLSGKPNKECFVCSYELTKMRLTVIKDFIFIMKSFEIYKDDNFIGGTLYRFPNGSFIKFIGLDKDDVGKGLRSDVLFINEANKVNLETARQLISRSKNVYLDWNPDSDFWYHHEYMDRSDCQTLILNYMGNEAISPEEKTEILLYKEKGFNPDGSIKNKYWANKWNVYGLGLEGAVDGTIFNNWDTYKELPADVQLYRLMGVDWGGNDPTTLIDVYIDETGKRIFVREIVYQPQILNDKLIEIIRDNGGEEVFVICDSSRKDKIYELQMAGLRALGCTKGAGSKIEGIERLQQYQIFIHEDSENIINEFSNYKWIRDSKTEKNLNEPEDGNDHAIDPLAYCLRFYKKSVNPR